MAIPKGDGNDVWSNGVFMGNLADDPFLLGRLAATPPAALLSPVVPAPVHTIAARIPTPVNPLVPEVPMAMEDQVFLDPDNPHTFSTAAGPVRGPAGAAPDWHPESHGIGVNVNLLSALEPGADLRDFPNGTAPISPTPIGGSLAAVAILRLLGPLSGAARTFFVRFGTNVRIRWAEIPGWLQTALIALGITAGVDILMDIPGIPGEGTILPFGGGGIEHIPPGIGASHIIGQWVANGVTFYRLADGKLAVQNKHGRWKVWRPKKPIVIFAGGAGNLRTMIRADRALNAQAKKIAAMLNRRAPRPRRKAPEPEPNKVIVVDAHHN